MATRDYGLPNQPWIARQAGGMSALDMKILCWNYAGENNAAGPPVLAVPTEAYPYYSRKRWLYRLGNAASGNFYAAPRHERAILRKLIKDTNPAAILCYFGDMALRLIDIAGEFHIPVIAYLHGDWNFIKDPWHRWSFLRRLNEFAAIVVVTRKEQAWMLAHGAMENKLHVIPCGAPTHMFSPQQKKSGSEIRFVMASRLVDEKGCKESVEAFAGVAAQQGNVRLEIFGDGPERQKLEAMVQSLGLQQRVKFHGYIDEHSLAKALPRCDIFIQHSLKKEGSPVSIAEAMLCAIPVVATPVGGIVDQVVDGGNGLLIAEHDVKGMSEAMLRLARDEHLRHKMGESGRKKAVEQFDSGMLTGRLQQVVIDACEKH